MRKDKFLSKSVKDNGKSRASKLWCSFSQTRKISAWIRQWTHRKNKRFFAVTSKHCRDWLILHNQSTSSCLKGYQTNIKLPIRPQTRTPWGDTADLSQQRAGRLHMWQNNSKPCRTSRRTQLWLWDKLGYYVTPKKWSADTSHCKRLIIVYGGVWSRYPPKNLVTKDEMKTMGMAAFTNLKKKTFQKHCMRFRIDLEVLMQINGKFIE